MGTVDRIKEKLEHNQKVFVKLTEPFEDGSKAEIVKM